MPGWLTTVMCRVLLGHLGLLVRLGRVVMILLSRLFALRLRMVETGSGLLSFREQKLYRAPLLEGPLSPPVMRKIGPFVWCRTWVIALLLLAMFAAVLMMKMTMLVLM